MHDVECAAYDLDLTIWRDLAGRAGGPVLDIGAGTGRVAIDLARIGHEVTALKRVRIGGLDLGAIQPGEFREILRKEIAKAFPGAPLREV